MVQAQDRHRRRHAGKRPVESKSHQRVDGLDPIC